MDYKMTVEDIDVAIPYSEEYRVRWVDGEPEEYDYCFHWVKVDGRRIQVTPYVVESDGNRSRSIEWSPEVEIVVEVPDEATSEFERLLTQSHVPIVRV